MTPRTVRPYRRITASLSMLAALAAPAAPLSISNDHLAVTYDQATRRVCVYVNGELQSEGTEMGLTSMSEDTRINLAMRALYDFYLVLGLLLGVHLVDFEQPSYGLTFFLTIATQEHRGNGALTQALHRFEREGFHFI